MTLPPADTAAPPPDRADVLAELKENAEYLQPRLFAIYGILNPSRASESELPFVGWGLDCRDDQGAVFVDPVEGGTHTSDSADRILALYQRLGEAYLVWLD